MPSEDSPPSHELLKDEKSSLVAAHQEIQQSYQFQGPIPPPSMLKEYEQVVPGCAGRIVGMAEENQSHYRTLEKDDQGTQHKLLLRGQLFSFLVASFAIICGAVLIALDSVIIGAVMAIGSLFGCAALYIRGEFLHRDNPDKEQE